MKKIKKIIINDNKKLLEHHRITAKRNCKGQEYLTIKRLYCAIVIVLVHDTQSGKCKSYHLQQCFKIHVIWCFLKGTITNSTTPAFVPKNIQSQYLSVCCRIIQDIPHIGTTQHQGKWLKPKNKWYLSTSHNVPVCY